jgi:hypothetical protein
MHKSGDGGKNPGDARVAKFIFATDYPAARKRGLRGGTGASLSSTGASNW